MLGNFTYCNPTKIYFGEEALLNLHEELKNMVQTLYWFMEVVPSKRMVFMIR